MNEFNAQTLSIVGREVAATLNDARLALEAGAERPGDLEPLRRVEELSATTHGVLEVVGVHGGALLAREIRAVAAYLGARGAAAPPQADALDALMRAVVQLPAYVERVLRGGRDLALVLLPLMNDLRAVRGAPFMSEGAALGLSLACDAGPPASVADGEGPRVPIGVWARKLRTQFQLALLGWLKDEKPVQNLAVLAEVAGRLESVAATRAAWHLWWVTAAIFEAIRDGGLEPAPALKRLLGQCDRELKRLYEQGEEAYAEAPPLELLNNLLYSLAHARSTGGRVSAVKAAFRLEEQLPLEDEIEQERESLSAPSARLMQTVAAAIREDLARVKDALDIFTRKGGQPEELGAQVELLKKIGDTLAVLGLGSLRDHVHGELSRLTDIATRRSPPQQDVLVGIAAALIAVEDALDGALLALIMPQSRPETDSALDAEFRPVAEAVLREALVNLARIKDAITQALQPGGDVIGLDSVPQLARGIFAALVMLDRLPAAEVVNRLGRMITRLVGRIGETPDPLALQRLADAVVAIECYLETLQGGRYEPLELLDSADHNLALLEQTVPAAHVVETVAEAPAAAPPAVQRPRPAAVAPVDDELVGVFIEEAREEIEHIHQLFPLWVDNEADHESLVRIRRSFHTLKGSGRMVGARRMGDFAWAIENLLNRVLDGTRQRTGAMVGLLTESVAALPQIIDELEHGTPVRARVESLISRAQACAEGREPDVGVVVEPGAEPAVPHYEPTQLLPRLDQARVLAAAERAAQEQAMAPVEALVPASVAPAPAPEPVAPAPEPMAPAAQAVAAELEAALERASTTALPVPEPARYEPTVVLPRVEVAALAAAAASEAAAALAAEALLTPPASTTAVEPALGAESVFELAPTFDLQSVFESEPVAVGEGPAPLEPVPAAEPIPPVAAEVAPAAVPAAESQPGLIPAPESSSPPEAAPEAAVAAEPLAAATSARQPEPEIVPEREPAPEPESASMDRSLQDIFVKEVESHLEVLRRFLRRAWTVAGPHRVSEELYRACHTLRGASRTAESGPSITLSEPLHRWVMRLFDHDIAFDEHGLSALADAVAVFEDILEDQGGGTRHERRLRNLLVRLDALDQAARHLVAESVKLPAVTEPAAAELPSAAETPLPAAETLSLDAPEAVEVEAWPVVAQEAPTLVVETPPIAAQAPLAVGEEAPLAVAEEEWPTAVEEILPPVAEESVPVAAEMPAEAEEAPAGLAAVEAEPIAVAEEPAPIETGEAFIDLGTLAEAAAPAAGILESLPGIVVEAAGPATFDIALAGAEPVAALDETAEPPPAVAAVAESVAPTEPMAPTEPVMPTEPVAFAEPAPLAEHVEQAPAAAPAEIEPPREPTFADLELPVEQASGVDIASAYGLHFDATITVPTEVLEEALAEPVPAPLGPSSPPAHGPEIPPSPEPAVALAPAIEEEPRPAAADADTGLDEEFDADIAAIFCEEAAELLESADTALASLRAERGSRDRVFELQRGLHTLKGGARMAGIRAMGDLSHELESLLLQAEAGVAPVDEHVFAVLQASLDELGRMRDQVTAGRGARPARELIERIRRLGRGAAEAKPAAGVAPVEPEAPAAPEPVATAAAAEAPAAAAEPATATAAAVPEPPAEPQAEPEPLIDEHALISDDAVTAAAEAVPAPAEAIPAEAEPAAAAPAAAVLPGREVTAERAEMARVDAELLDSMLNNAGEVSIFRARLEQQVSSIEFNLAELGRVVQRFKDQLRKLEIETEAQILHRHVDSAPRREDFDPLELDRYSSIQQYSRALAETAADVGSVQNLLENLTREAQNLLTQQGRVVSDLQGGLMRTRMVPFQRHVQRLTRIVRQAAADTGKRVELVVQGAAGELDRQVLERMLPPFEHMLRNSVVHGLESPADREAAGKPPAGRIDVSLKREGSEVVIVVADDGAGINLRAVREKAVIRGLLGPKQEISDEEAMQLILEPGFSTAARVTQSAGRGVGMDVVASEVKKLGGALQTETWAGRGTRFTIRLPFTLAISQALVVRSGDELYALPLPTVEGVVRVPKSEVVRHLGEEMPSFEYGGQRYRFQHLGLFVGGVATVLPEHDAAMPVILARAGEHSTAIVTDELLGSREIVVKSVGPMISGIRGISGATILGDGRICIILDIGALVRSEWRNRALRPPEQDRADARVFALVVDDSITVRRVTQRLLERNGMRVMTAKDGIDAVAALQDVVPDVILLDIEMPRMDGYEVASHVRNDPRLRHIPIVMITSRVGEKHRARAIELGIDEYLGKPYQETQLLEAIEPLVHRRRATA